MRLRERRAPPPSPQPTPPHPPNPSIRPTPPHPPPTPPGEKGLIGVGISSHICQIFRAVTHREQGVDVSSKRGGGGGGEQGERVGGEIDEVAARERRRWWRRRRWRKISRDNERKRAELLVWKPKKEKTRIRSCSRRLFFPLFVLLEEGERKKKKKKKTVETGPEERDLTADVCARVCFFSLRALVSLNVAPPGGRSGPIV